MSATHNSSASSSAHTRVGANKVMISSQEILLNAYVERDALGKVVHVKPIDETGHEASMTAFFSGVITPKFRVQAPIKGTSLYELMASNLAPKIDTNYTGTLLLWQHINLTTLEITSETKITEL